MLPYQLELIAQMRHQELLQQARHRRLLKISLRPQPVHHRSALRQVTIWAGTQLIRWGLKLQGHAVVSPGTSNDFYGKEPLSG